eukprot:CAMPEP_0172307380 /NCGR_PEP_ID=MMETSP1058-20130122/8260_1 /TAXON_ID=83371 /ORGANISM="Detonula confervacea, Strain CCMP 353" /LENGTH=321 /DNA_ID=CAMNT_0013019543 /DNA_START=62 /DNA_END=1027 /DNA_ORIENTATION=+
MAVAPIASGRTPFMNKNRRQSTRRLSSKGSKISSRSKGSKSVPAPHPHPTLFLPADDPITRPGSKSSKAGSKGYNDHGIISKSSKSSGDESSAESSKSGKAFEGAKTAKAHQDGVGYTNLFTDTSHVVIITDAPTPQPTKANDVIQAQTEAIKTFVVENDYSCTGAPCPIDNLCRSSYGTCGPGRMYCNVYSIWTQLCPSLAPTAPPTGSPTIPRPTRSPTTLFPTRSMATTTTSSANNFLPASNPIFATNSSPDNGPFEISDVSLKVVEEEDAAPLMRSYADDEQSDGSSSGFPVWGYVGIAFAVTMAVGTGVIIKTEYI